jgi:hypothetical protein
MASLASMLGYKPAPELQRGSGRGAVVETAHSFLAAGSPPVSALPADPRLLRSWQMRATGKLAAAAVLVDLGAERLASGGIAGITAKATKEIASRNLDDTFYVVDLANVLRMYKVGGRAT